MTAPTESESDAERTAPTASESDAERTATEERDFLLRSLDDLDAEYEAGDLDQADYETLRDGYVARTAEVLRAIEEHREAEVEAPPSPRRRRRTILWVSGVVVIAALSGWLLARSVGAKGSGETITGSAIDPLDACQKLSFQKPAQGVSCYDKILKSQPDNTDALTYKGWALVRSGHAAEGQALFDRVVAIDKTYPDVYVFRASVKANAGDFAGAQAELDTLYSLNPPAGVISTLQSQGLDREIAFGLLPAADQACWKQAEDGLSALSSDPNSKTGATKVTDSIECYAKQVAADPTDLQARLGSGYLIGSVGASNNTQLLAQAQANLDAAVALAPTDPTTRVLRAAFANVNGNPVAAEADLKVLKTLGRPSALYVLSPVDQIEKNVEDQLKATTTTTGG